MNFLIFVKPKKRFPASDFQSFFCNTCEKSFASPLILRRHIESIHKGIIYRCSTLCEKVFTYLSAMKRHQTAHLGIKNMNVTSATKTFHAQKTFPNIKNHVQQNFLNYLRSTGHQIQINLTNKCLNNNK